VKGAIAGTYLSSGFGSSFVKDWAADLKLVRVVAKEPRYLAIPFEMLDIEKALLWVVFCVPSIKSLLLY
jgi:hypothetical protein